MSIHFFQISDRMLWNHWHSTAFSDIFLKDVHAFWCSTIKHLGIFNWFYFLHLGRFYFHRNFNQNFTETIHFYIPDTLFYVYQFSASSWLYHLSWIMFSPWIWPQLLKRCNPPKTHTFPPLVPSFSEKLKTREKIRPQYIQFIKIFTLIFHPYFDYRTRNCDLHVQRCQLNLTREP